VDVPNDIREFLEQVKHLGGQFEIPDTLPEETITDIRLLREELSDALEFDEMSPKVFDIISQIESIMRLRKQEALNLSFLIDGFKKFLDVMCPKKDRTCYKNQATRALAKVLRMNPITPEQKQDLIDRIRMMGYEIKPALIASLKYSYLEPDELQELGISKRAYEHIRNLVNAGEHSVSEIVDVITDIYPVTEFAVRAVVVDLLSESGRPLYLEELPEEEIESLVTSELHEPKVQEEEHEKMRIRTMTPEQMLTRIKRITTPQKLFNLILMLSDELRAGELPAQYEEVLKQAQEKLHSMGYYVEAERYGPRPGLHLKTRPYAGEVCYCPNHPDITVKKKPGTPCLAETCPICGTPMRRGVEGSRKVESKIPDYSIKEGDVIRYVDVDDNNKTKEGEVKKVTTHDGYVVMVEVDGNEVAAGNIIAIIQEPRKSKDWTDLWIDFFDKTKMESKEDDMKVQNAEKLTYKELKERFSPDVIEALFEHGHMTPWIQYKVGDYTIMWNPEEVVFEVTKNYHNKKLVQEPGEKKMPLAVKTAKVKLCPKCGMLMDKVPAKEIGADEYGFKGNVWFCPICNEVIQASKKTAQGELEDEDEPVGNESVQEIPIEEQTKGPPLEPGETVEPEPEPEPEPKVHLLEKMTPMDQSMITSLEKQRQEAIDAGDIETLISKDKEIIDVVKKYIEPITPESMTAESFIGRRLQTHIGIRRDYIPVISKASEAIRQIPKLFKIAIGSVSLVSCTVSEYELEPDTGEVEFAVAMKPITGTLPFRMGVVKINVNKKTTEIVPYIWDTTGRKYNFDEDGLRLFLGVDESEQLLTLEKSYLEEERKIDKDMNDKRIGPNVTGPGREPVGIDDKGVSKPKTSWP